VQPFCAIGVVVYLQQGMAVVGNGGIDVGKKTPNPKPGRPIVERFAKGNGYAEPRMQAPNTVRIKRPGVCGAMSQQSADSGNQSAPQKFVHLVGCRDPNARPEPWIRPTPVKR
jgi:hypothetical protein